MLGKAYFEILKKTYGIVFDKIGAQNYSLVWEMTSQMWNISWNKQILQGIAIISGIYSIGHYVMTW